MLGGFIIMLERCWTVRFESSKISKCCELYPPGFSKTSPTRCITSKHKKAHILLQQIEDPTKGNIRSLNLCIKKHSVTLRSHGVFRRFFILQDSRNRLHLPTQPFLHQALLRKRIGKLGKVLQFPLALCWKSYFKSYFSCKISMVLFGIRSFVKFPRWAEVGTWDANQFDTS